MMSAIDYQECVKTAQEMRHMSTLIHSLLDAIEAEDFEGDATDAADDMVASAVALLALAISRLPPAQQEVTLQAIEDRGALRSPMAARAYCRRQLLANAAIAASRVAS
jgi:hypothetical protein